jgi:hypothetical protein
MDEKRQGTDRRITQRRKTWYVDDWRNAWKWLSVQIPAVMAAFAVIYEALPQVQDYIPHAWLPYIGAVGAVGLIFGRLKAQK